MKYKVQLLNYDSEWVTYCESPTQFYAAEAEADLHRHGFQNHQIQIVKKP